MRAFINERAKQETSFLSIRKERTGSDMQGATYWYESDPIAGHRLYRELQGFNGKEKVKLRGQLVSAPAMGLWETLATNLDEFQSVADRLCSSRNRMEVVIGTKINSNCVPDLINAEKKKQRVLKKQLRQASLLDSDFNVGSVACSRPRRERKPVSYTFDDYDDSINEAIDVMKGLHASRVMQDEFSAGQNGGEEIDAKSQGLVPNVPKCDTDISSAGCNNDDNVACVNEHLHKRRRAGSLDAIVCDLKEEKSVSEMDSKAAVHSKKGNLHATKELQESLTQSSTVTSSKADEHEKMEVEKGEIDMVRNREGLGNAGLGGNAHLLGNSKASIDEGHVLTDIRPTSNGIKQEP